MAAVAYPLRVPAPRGAVPRAAHPSHHRPVATSAATYRRRRLLVAAVALGVLHAVASLVPVRLGSGPLSAPEPPSLPVASRVYVVEPGDTLWSIATDLGPGEDPRPIVDELIARRGDGPLRVGERIILS